MGMYDQQEEKKTAFEWISSILGSIGAIIFESIEAIVIALALSIALYLFLVTPHQVEGRSMVPTFQNQEHILANKAIYKFREPERGDVIVFKHSATADYIKRVIGLPGDEVSLIDGKIYINNKQLDESDYLDPAIVTNGGNVLQEGGTVTVPNGQVFVMGDNRQHSTDSRFFGPIDESTIKGEVFVVYFPFNHFRLIHDPDYNL